jgi:hypothetical protein
MKTIVATVALLIAALNLAGIKLTSFDVMGLAVIVPLLTAAIYRMFVVFGSK